jgi:hypothetical protein
MLEDRSYAVAAGAAQRQQDDRHETPPYVVVENQDSERGSCEKVLAHRNTMPGLRLALPLTGVVPELYLKATSTCHSSDIRAYQTNKR